jgi:SecD/SecF fusion protein
MTTSLKIKFAFLAMVLLLAVSTVLPSFYSGMPQWWKTYLSPGGLRLGLDLQGGMHLVLKVNLKKAEENTLQFAANDLKDALAEQSISAVRTSATTPDSAVFTLPNAGAVEKVKKIAADDFSDIDVRVEAKEGSFPRIFLTLKEEKRQFIKNNAVNQSLEILRNRIDQFGVAEPVIIRQGEDEIVIQLPGVKDPERAMKLLGDTAQLEFKLVADSTGLNLQEMVAQAKASKEWLEGESLQKLNRALQNKLPDNTTLYFEKEIDKKTKQEVQIPLLLENKILMTGDMVKDAQVRIGGSFNEPYVGLDLTSNGGRVFAQVTEANVGRRLAIVLDDVVRSAPVIRDRILGGSAQITGSFSHEEAADLSIVLRVGALPAPVDIIQNMSVGASLGQDSISQGLTAGLWGALMVVAFIGIYYRLCGIIANTAMIFNILLLFSGLAVLSATLTLPGIAGIILSIGMAVDANVLIYERMREEFALGKSARSSVEAGYDKAFSSIVDSQVTTLITALALFLFGTGPIKGFAVTLTLGILFNLFTVLFYSRFVFDGMGAIRPMKTFTFMKMFAKTSFNFMRVKRLAFAFSSTLVLIGLISMVQIWRGQANLGVDFSGGSLLQYKASTEFSMAEVRTALANGDLPDVDIQQVENEQRLIVKAKKSQEVVANLADKVSAVLTAALPDKGFALESESEIGSSVSSTLRNQALVAIILSFVGIIVYLAFRFDIRFGVAAAVSTFHDIIVLVGICWLLNLEFTLLIVTALLTLAGYSLNDTVVVFDRIRENALKAEKDHFETTINTSINETLSRTVITGMTTLFTLLALMFFGGAVLYDFAFVLTVGILFGTYSSIFVASPLLTVWKRKGSELGYSHG